jgi:ATP-dependent RNA helicase DeaD
VRARDKYAALKRIVDFNPEIFGIIFTRTKLESQEIAENLIKDGYNADALHGDLSQQQRDKVMQRFRNKALQILVATDVAARGIDVDNVTHVINYSLPDDVESYTHRSGRTARAGKKGLSLAIINKKEVGRIRQIERIIKRKFTLAHIPSGFEVCEKQLFAFIHKIHNIEGLDEQIEAYLPRVNKEFADLSKEELIKRFTALEFKRFLDYYKNAPDLNESEDRRGGRDSGDSNEMRGGRGGFKRLFMNLGSLDDFNRGDMLRFICDNARITGRQVGRIDIKGVYSFFEVEHDVVDMVFTGFKNVEHEGRKVRIEVSNDGDKRRDEKRKGYGGGSKSGHSNKKRYR